MIDRYGVEPVMGRPVLSAGEMRSMTICENLIAAYQGRAQAKNHVDWALDNPKSAALLAKAETAWEEWLNEQ